MPASHHRHPRTGFPGHHSSPAGEDRHEIARKVTLRQASYLVAIATMVYHHLDAIPADSEFWGWVTRTQPRTVALVDGAVLHRAPHVGSRLARAWWPLVHHHPSASGQADLAAAGERAAIDAREPFTLSALLGLSAHEARQRHDYKTAERQWVRELAIYRELCDYTVAIPVVESLGELYIAWDRLHRALDAYYELLHLHHALDDIPGAVRALRAVAATMTIGQRPRDAADTRREADALARTAPDQPDPEPSFPETVVSRHASFTSEPVPRQATSPQDRAQLASELGALYAKGYIIRDLAFTIGWSYSSVYRLLRDHDVPLRPRGQRYASPRLAMRRAPTTTDNDTATRI